MTTAILYIHGFLSAPQSYKAKATQAWLAQQRPDINFVCPMLSSYPDEAAPALEQVLAALGGQTVYAIGSSLGGFWATWLVERNRVERAVLINPAVCPQHLIADRLGVPLKNYYTQATCTLHQSHVNYIAQCDSDTLTQRDRYWLMVQTGDETLDYREAVKKYSGCQQTLEYGGSHTFEGYENWLPHIIQFFENKS